MGCKGPYRGVHVETCVNGNDNDNDNDTNIKMSLRRNVNEPLGHIRSESCGWRKEGLH